MQPSIAHLYMSSSKVIGSSSFIYSYGYQILPGMESRTRSPRGKGEQGRPPIQWGPSLAPPVTSFTSTWPFSTRLNRGTQYSLLVIPKVRP